MKNKLVLFCLFLISLTGFSQTMTFNTGPTHPGFTLNGWSSASGVIWFTNLASPFSNLSVTITFVTKSYPLVTLLRLNA
jgi:hypothetical protein